MDNFDVAAAAARRCARKLLKAVPPTIIADAMIEVGLAVWAAATGRAEDAKVLLRVWVAARDAK